MFDYVIKNGNIADGSGSPAFKGDVGLKNGKIAAVGSIPTEAAKQTIDAKGKYVAPGFIDIHRHGDMAAFRQGFGELELRQGITSMVNGNCGMSAAPVDKANAAIAGYLKPVLGELLENVATGSMADYLRSLSNLGLPVNCAMLVGCGVIWASLLGYDGRRPDAGDFRSFHKILERELAAGALGASLGLGYAPECFLTTDELIESLRPLQNTDTPIAFHMRQEGDGVCNSVKEVIEIGRALNAPVHISHLKAMGKRNWQSKIPEALCLIRGAKEAGVNISCDFYPYTAGSTQLIHILPPDYIEGGAGAIVQRLRDAAKRAELKQRIANGRDFDNIAGMVGWDNIVLSTLVTEENKKFAGMTVAEAARERNVDPVDCVCDLLIEESCAITMIDFITCEEDIAEILAFDGVSVISDSLYPVSGKPHPRLYGCFARVLERYVKERKVISPEQAVRAMTANPATALNIKGKGLIKEGMDGDICVFDLNAVHELGSYREPEKYAAGFEWVFVNGRAQIADGKLAASPDTR